MGHGQQHLAALLASLTLLAFLVHTVLDRLHPEEERREMGDARRVRVAKLDAAAGRERPHDRRTGWTDRLNGPPT